MLSFRQVSMGKRIMPGRPPDKASRSSLHRKFCSDSTAGVLPTGPLQRVLEAQGFTECRVHGLAFRNMKPWGLRCQRGPRNVLGPWRQEEYLQCLKQHSHDNMSCRYLSKRCASKSQETSAAGLGLLGFNPQVLAVSHGQEPNDEGAHGAAGLYRGGTSHRDVCGMLQSHDTGRFDRTSRQRRRGRKRRRRPRRSR